ncbi:MAG: SIR2 family NAD-dependent protein deacylase [Spirochaetota bacterium]
MDYGHALQEAANALRRSAHVTAFTGAGISVESGVPQFRGNDGLWAHYDPAVFDINHFRSHPRDSWQTILEIFYYTFAKVEPNAGHYALAELEQRGVVREIITQNIDSLHHRAGSTAVWEYHGNSRELLCLSCGARHPAQRALETEIPPRCTCGGLLKPDFIFFGEQIPAQAARESERAARECDLMLVVGTTGEVYPAGFIPHMARESGARIVEINPEPSTYTEEITDVFIHEKSATALPALLELISSSSTD